MAYIVNVTKTPTAIAATFQASIGLHVTNDLLLIKLSQDGGGTAIAPDSAAAAVGWTMIGTQAASGGNRSAWAYLIAPSSSVTNPTFTGANDDWIATCLVVRGAATTGTIQANARSDWNNPNPASSVSAALTTTDTDCLLIYSWSADGVSAPTYMRTLEPTSAEGVVAVDWSGEIAVTHIIGYRQQVGSTTVPQTTMYVKNQTEGGNGWVLAIKNASGTETAPFCDSGINELLWYGELGAQRTPVTWNALSGFSGGAVGSISTVNLSSVVSAAGSGVSADIWGSWTALTSTESTAGAWVGGYHTISSTNMTGKIFTLQWMEDNVVSAVGSKGIAVAFSDGTNWVAYQISQLAGTLAGFRYTSHVALGYGTPLDSSGSINWAGITQIAYMQHRIGATTNNRAITINNALLCGTTTLTGGGVSSPANAPRLAELLNTYSMDGLATIQGTSQALGKTPVQIGDGSTPTNFNVEAAPFCFPQVWNATGLAGTQRTWNTPANHAGVNIKASAADTISLAAGIFTTTTIQPFTIDAASSTSAAYDTNGCTIVGYQVTWKTGVPCGSATFSQCGKIMAKGANFTDTTIKKTTATDASISFDTSGATMTRCTINTPDTANYHIELDTGVTGITLADATFAGAPATNKIHVLATTGTVTITISGSTSLTSGQVTSAGATIVISAPTYQRGQNFTGLVAGSQVKVFATGTDTEKFSTNNSGTSEQWDDATSGAVTVDYVIQKAGYLPIRVAGVVLTGALSGGVIATPITQSIDRAYATSSGLTLNTNFFANATTKLAGLTVASTVQNVYSYLIEQWIALGGTGGAYANKAFPMVANGPNSFSWLNGWTFDLTTYSGSITNLSRDGMRYLNTSGAVTAMWAALLSVGVPAGEKVRYRQSDSGTTTDAQATGNIDQLVQILDDPNGDGVYSDGYDRRGFLALKCQADGYDEAAIDAIATYGNLEDQLYVVGLTPLNNGLATGNPSLANPPVITDHGASPVTWNGKAFSITITDSAAGNSGTLIERWLRYNFELGGTFQGVNAFCWHDLAQTNGSKFKTVRGAIYGDTGAALKGVRVVRNDGTTAHADFDLFTADDGTTYSPPVTANVSITGMPDAGGAYDRLQIINFTATTAASRANSTAYALGDIRLRQTGIGSENTAGLYLRCTTAGTSAASPPTWNTTPGGTTADGTATWTTYKVLFYDADPASTSMGTTYTNGNEFLSGESVKIRFAEMNAGTSFKTFSTTTIASSAGFSVVVDELADDVYATNALDGSSYETTFSPNFGTNYIVLDTNTDFSGKSAYAYFCLTLTSSSGMYFFWGGVTALDTGNYRIETDVLDIYFDETLGFVKQTDAVRIFRKDGLRPAIDPTTGGFGIEINWRTPVSVVSTGGSALTPTESSQLMSLPAATAVATAVWNKTLP